MPFASWSATYLPHQSMLPSVIAGAVARTNRCRENFAGHLAEIKISSLSRTFRDAVEVCKRLNEQYLWIDSICIIQDDDEDKANEIPRMQALYEGAALTITAMSTRDGRGGCWIPRKHEFTLSTGEEASVELAFHRSLDPMSTHAPFLETGVESDLHARYPLATRKWTLQERVLSRRLLHFTADDLVWECRSSAYCACGTVDVLFPNWNQRTVFEILSGQETNAFMIVMKWMELVVSYSRAKISIHADTFPALAGLASGFSNKGLGKYCAGLWEASLPLTLCWSVDHGRSDEEVFKTRISEFVAPTWSWASVEGPLCFDAMNNLDSDIENYLCVARVIFVECEADSEFGQVRAGAIKIFTLAYVVPPRSITETLILGLENADFRIDTLSDIPQEQKCILALIFVRFDNESRALVLVDNDDGTYSRCGLLRLPDKLMVRFVKTQDYMELEIV